MWYNLEKNTNKRKKKNESSKNNLLFNTFTNIFIYFKWFFSSPYIAKKEIVKNLDEILITKTKIEKIYFNPLTLNLELKNFSLIDEKEQEVVGLKNLFTQLSHIENRKFPI